MTMTPYYQRNGITLYCGEALPVMCQLAPQSISALVTDPPYYKVLRDKWDYQWRNIEDYLNWLDEHLWEGAKALQSNGSLYMFASPTLAGRVEALIAERFNVLNHIVWVKPKGRNRSIYNKSKRRKRYVNITERLIFAEKPNDLHLTQDALRAQLFEPIRCYLHQEKKRAGLTTPDVDRITGSTSTGRHAFRKSQWLLPTKENYEALQAACEGFFCRSYAELQAEHETLKANFEQQLRADKRFRPFHLPEAVTDVWQAKPVNHSRMLHPAQKPLALMNRIVKTSTREGDIILDPFAGSGSTLVSAQQLGRRAIGIEIDEETCRIAVERLGQSTFFSIGNDNKCCRKGRTA